jgi:hypothetical protein
MIIDCRYNTTYLNLGRNTGDVLVRDCRHFFVAKVVAVIGSF